MDHLASFSLPLLLLILPTLHSRSDDCWSAAFAGTRGPGSLTAARPRRVSLSIPTLFTQFKVQASGGEERPRPFSKIPIGDAARAHPAEVWRRVRAGRARSCPCSPPMTAPAASTVASSRQQLAVRRIARPARICPVHHHMAGLRLTTQPRKGHAPLFPGDAYVRTARWHLHRSSHRRTRRRPDIAIIVKICGNRIHVSD